MATPIKIKRSAVPGKVPTTGDLSLGELALNTYDGKLYTKKDNGTASVVEIGGGGGTGSGVVVGTGDPTTTPADGALYLDNASHVFFVRSGGQWRRVFLGPITWATNGLTWNS